MASPQLSGYQCQFVDSVEDYECPLCLHVTREPSLTSCCGQHFCQGCISRILTDNKPCPFCKEKGFSTFLDKKQKRRVLNLKVYCDKKGEGCQWVGGLEILTQHLEEKCHFIAMTCSNNCGLTFQRRLVKEHETQNCPKRPHKCQYCQKEGTYQEIQEDHLPVCPKHPVQCPNKCGVSPLVRNQLEDHLRECPLQLVECEFREMGCEEMVKRKDLPRHVEEGAQKHLRLMVSIHLKYQAEKIERNCKLERLESQIKGLTETQDKMKEHISELEEDLKKEKTDKINLKSQFDMFKKHLNIELIQCIASFTTFRQLDRLTDNTRWKNETTFHSCPSNCKLRINLYFYNDKKRLDVELTHVPSHFGDNFEWPMKFTMTVRLLNYEGDRDHYQVTQNVRVRRGKYNDDIRIPYSVIEKPPHGVRYIKDGNITLQVLVTEK